MQAEHLTHLFTPLSFDLEKQSLNTTCNLAVSAVFLVPSAASSAAISASSALLAFLAAAAAAALSSTAILAASAEAPPASFAASIVATAAASSEANLASSASFLSTASPLLPSFHVVFAVANAAVVAVAVLGRNVSINVFE